MNARSSKEKLMAENGVNAQIASNSHVLANLSAQFSRFPTRAFIDLVSLHPSHPHALFDQTSQVKGMFVRVTRDLGRERRYIYMI